MRTRRLAAALAAATLLMTTACGGDEGTEAESSATAAEESPPGSPTDEPTAQASESGEPDLDPAAFGQALVDAQVKAGSVHLRGRFGQGVEMTGKMDFSAGEPAMDMTMTGAQLGGEAQMILVDGAMYMQVPGAGMGNKFLKVDASDPDNPLARSLRSMDPSSSFKAFEAVTSLERVGEDTVDGVPTTHYSVTVDTEKSLKAQGVDPSQASALPPEVTYDVWVGEDDLVRKMVMGPEAGNIELLLSKWGAPVRISAPPPAQVQEMPRSRG